MKIHLPIVTLTMTAACLLIALFTVPAANPTLSVAVAPVKDAVKEVTKEEVSPHRDVNGDGIVDSLFIDQEGGSAYGGSYLTIVDGQSKKTHSADNADFYGAAVSLCAIAISEPSFASAAEELLLPKERRQTFDPLGSWVIEANAKKRILSGNDNFDLVTKPRLTWVDNKDIPSADYCVKVPAAKGRRYLKNRARHPDEEFAIKGISITGSSASVWFVWKEYRFNKEPLREVFRGDKSAIYANSNCVGIEREDGRFAWLFVNDEWLLGRTGGGIESVEVHGGVILLILDGLKNVVIESETGKLASLKPYSGLDNQANIKPSTLKAFKAL